MAEKMEKKDLTIGDWVYIKEYPMKQEAKKMCAEHYLRSLCEFEPVHLTDEILRLNGFEYNHKAYANYKDTNIGVWCHWNYSYTDDERYSMYNHVGIWFVLGSEEMKISYVHDGFKSVPWGSESEDWTNANKEWTDADKYMKHCIKNENYVDALCHLQTAIKNLVAENRKIVAKEGFLQPTIDKIAAFNKLPWYKKMFYKF